jgi:hypothetical protein
MQFSANFEKCTKQVQYAEIAPIKCDDDVTQAEAIWPVRRF